MIRDCGIGQRTTGNEHQIVTLLESRMEFAHGLAEPPFDPIPAHCLTDAPTNREAITIMLQTVRRYAQHEQPRRDRAPTSPNGLEIARAAESKPPRDHDTTYRLFVVSFFSSETVSFQRPLSRRRFSTARPPRVLMRAKKPCTRLRRSRFGWYVRFGTVSLPARDIPRTKKPAPA